MTRQQKHKERTAAKNEGRARPKKQNNYNSFNSKAKLNRKETILIMFYKEMSIFQLFDTFTPCILCIEFADLVSCGISLF